MKKRDRYHQSFSVSYNYPVLFTKDLFHRDNPSLRHVVGTGRRHDILVMADAGVMDASAGLSQRIQTYFSHHDDLFRLKGVPHVFPGGEGVKNSWTHVHGATKIISDGQVDRHSFILAVGGGAFLDMAGFAAAISHRGIKLIRVPTTTLAQDDAGIGVKNGINDHGQKNYIGTFAPPFAVINDSLFLKTLPFHHYIGGVAEAFKIALIRDVGFFSFLVDHAECLRERNLGVMEETIFRCARLHLDHIGQGGDPFETGSARPLDYGHWSAHEIEVASRHRVSHGQAVSVGIALDSFYAWKIGLLCREEFEILVSALIRCGLPVWDSALEPLDRSGNPKVMAGLERFRQHLGGRLTFTMPSGVGKATELHEMDPGLVIQGIAALRTIASAHASCN